MNGHDVHLLRDPVPGEDPPTDAFGVEPLATRLARLLESVRPPFTVSLSGAWGIGKTTLTESVRVCSTLLVGSLDLWAEDIDQLRRAIVIEIGSQLRGGGDAARDEVAKELDKALHASVTLSRPSPRLGLRDIGGRLLRDPAAAVWAVAVLILWILGFLLVVTYFEGVGAQVLGQLLTAAAVFLLIQSGIFVTIATTTESMAPAEAHIATLVKFRELATTSQKDDRPVLMILDNLDRLSGEEAIKALGEIRSLVDIQGSRCLFLIPVDRSALARHLEEQLGDVEASAARDFLDKFFNLDIVLTRPASLDLRGWARTQIAELLPHTDDASRSELAQIVASAAGGSPRLIKRMLNGTAARYALLDERVRAEIPLAQLALVEALVSRHPNLIETLARNPQAFVDARANLAKAVVSEERTTAVDEYLQIANVSMSGASRNELRDFLLQNEDVTLTGDALQGILALREDRVWRGVSIAAELKRALNTGEDDVFGAGIEALSPDERDAALRATVETTRSLLWNRFDRDGLVAINAVARVIVGTPHEAALRRIGQELLLNASPAVLTTAGIDLLFDGTSNGRALAVKDRLVESLTGGQIAANPQPLMRALRNSFGLVSSGDIEALQKSLAGYQDADLDVLFDAGPHAVLLRGAVAEGYRTRLANWDPADVDQQPAISGAERLIWLDKQEPFDGAFEPIAARFNSLVSSTPVERLPTLKAAVALLRRTRTPSPDADALIQQLGQWSPEPIEGLTLAWRLPGEPPAFAAIRGPTETLFASAPVDRLERFVREHRAKLIANGIPVAALLGNRFASTGDPGFARLAVEKKTAPASVDDFVSAIEAIADADVYLQRTSELVVIFQKSAQLDGLNALSEALGRRIAGMSAPELPEAANRVLALAKAGASIVQPSAAIESRIGIAQAGDLAGVATAIERLAVAKLPDTDQLPGKVISRSGALGELDLATAVSLGRHGSTSAQSLRQVVASAVAKPTNAPAALQPVLDGLRSKLRRDWHVTAATVARAVSLPQTEATDLLRMVEKWNAPPPTVPERATYDSQLTQIADSNLAPDDLITKLRG